MKTLKKCMRCKKELSKSTKALCRECFESNKYKGSLGHLKSLKNEN